MIERGLKGVRLVVGDRCAGLVSTVNSTLPKAGYQRRMVHFIRNVLSKVPPSHREWASAALKACSPWNHASPRWTRRRRVRYEGQEAEGGRRLPARGHPGDDYLPAG